MRYYFYYCYYYYYIFRTYDPSFANLATYSFLPTPECPRTHNRITEFTYITTNNEDNVTNVLAYLGIPHWSSKHLPKQELRVWRSAVQRILKKESKIFDYPKNQGLILRYFIERIVEFCEQLLVQFSYKMVHFFF